jgi:very-short-patch-repair endonuclease
MDAAVRLRLADRPALMTSRRLRPLAELVAHAESPMETRLRWLLIQAGLPHPEVQTDLRDSDGRFVGRADLYYHSARLVIEYDGANHRDRLVEDNRRQNALINAGFQVLRFTAADVHQRPDVVTASIRRALSRSLTRA